MLMAKNGHLTVITAQNSFAIATYSVPKHKEIAFCCAFSSDGTLANIKKGLTVHTGGKPHECVICANQFPQQNSLILPKTKISLHAHESHVGSKTFGVRNSLHSVASYNQTVQMLAHCGWLRFMQSSKLTVHMQGHTGEWPVI